MNQGGNHEPTAEQNCELGADPNAQIATAIQCMTDLLTQIVDRYSQNPINQPKNPRNHVEEEDKALKRFQKFSPPTFFEGPNPDVAEK